MRARTIFLEVNKTIYVGIEIGILFLGIKAVKSLPIIGDAVAVAVGLAVGYAVVGSNVGVEVGGASPFPRERLSRAESEYWW